MSSITSTLLCDLYDWIVGVVDRRAQESSVTAISLMSSAIIYFAAALGRR